MLVGMGWKKWLVIPLLAPLACAGFSGSPSDPGTADGGASSNDGGAGNDDGARPADASGPLGPCPIAKGSTTPIDPQAPTRSIVTTTTGAVRDIATTHSDIYWLEQQTVGPPPTSWTLQVRPRTTSSSGASTKPLVKDLSEATAIAILADSIYMATAAGIERVKLSCGEECVPERVVDAAQLTGTVRTLVTVSKASIYVTVDGSFELKVDPSSSAATLVPLKKGVSVGLAVGAPGTLWFTNEDPAPVMQLFGEVNGVAIKPIDLPTGALHHDWLATDCKSVYIPRYDFGTTLSVNVLTGSAFGPDLTTDTASGTHAVSHVAIDERYLYVATTDETVGIRIFALNGQQPPFAISDTTLHIAVDDEGIYFGPASFGGPLLQIPKTH